jgi:hypothetical protein
MNTHDDPIKELPSRLPTDEEKYFSERAYKEIVESIARIEEVAKFLIGATATTSGLYLAAFKLARGDTTVAEPLWFVPFGCWALSLTALVLVLFPGRYETGRDVPQSWKDAYRRARDRKYRWLAVGTCFFIAGIFAAAFPFTK